MTLSPGSRPAASAAPRPALTTGRRPQFSVGGLWTRGLVAACAAILAIITITLLVRGFLGLDAFQSPGDEGNPNTGPLAAGACIATLIGVALLQVLLQRTDRPFELLDAAMVLGFLAFLGATLSGGLTPSQMGGQLVVAVPTGVIIRMLLSWVGHASTGTYAT
jgi:hypothetical protein